MPRIISFKINEEDLKRLDYFAMRMGVNRSDIIREAILNYLSANEKIALNTHEKTKKMPP
jgi:metal-responsive CopG/Arc/MetJ family transcriptional regulator